MHGSQPLMLYPLIQTHVPHFDTIFKAHAYPIQCLPLGSVHCRPESLSLPNLALTTIALVPPLLLQPHPLLPFPLLLSLSSPGMSIDTSLYTTSTRHNLYSRTKPLHHQYSKHCLSNFPTNCQKTPLHTFPHQSYHYTLS